MATKKLQIPSGVKLLPDIVSQGRSAKYTFSTGGWKRILNIIRASNGEIDLGLVCNFPYRSTQILAFDMSGYVKYPKQTDGTQGDTTASSPVLIKRYENSFGIKGTQNAPQAKITKVRIGYPAPGTSFPEKPEDDYEHNPVNCYVDIYVDIDESKIIEGRALPDFNMNYAGFANSHYCEAIEEETDATNTGIYGETLTFYEVNVANMNGYMTRNSINRDGIFPHYGLAFTGGGTGNDLRIVPATNAQIDEASNTCYNPITPANLQYALSKVNICPQVYEYDGEILIDELCYHEGNYPGEIIVFTDNQSETHANASAYMYLQESNDGNWLWKKLTGLTDADKKELVNDVIAALPVYDGSVV